MQLFSVKMKEGIVAASYTPGDKFYIDPAKLLPLARFLPQPKYILLFISAVYIISWDFMIFLYVVLVCLTFAMPFMLK